MVEFQMAGIFLILVFFSVTGHYLTLIAKFYRQKFMKGPRPQFMQAGLALIVAGLLMQLPMFGFLPGFLSTAFICLGGLAFSALAFALYRTMMSVS